MQLLKNAQKRSLKITQKPQIRSKTHIGDPLHPLPQQPLSRTPLKDFPRGYYRNIGLWLIADRAFGS